MARFTIYVALAAAFAATHAVLVSGRAESALSQRSSSSFESAMSAATEASESAAAAPPQHRDAARQGPASNSIVTETETVALPAISPRTETKRGAFF